MISEEQSKQIKQQLAEQINSTFPEEKKQSALEQIISMDAEELEKFLIQNNLIKDENSQNSCIFCSIIKGKIPTNKIAENPEAIATLEITPISKAHSIIIPKQHTKDAPKKAIELAQEISKKIKQIFNPKEIKIYTSKIFEHEIINVLPVYKDENSESKREKANQAELKEIQRKLKTAKISEQEKPKIKQQETISDKTYWLPKRKP